jgi:ribonuclease VapC
MIIDSSAITAILLGEPEAKAFNAKIVAAGNCSISVASLLEVTMVIESRKGDDGRQQITELLSRGKIKVIPVDLEQGEIARDAFRRFGKGRHAAGLNFGDCFSYALAMSTGEPLLFKGTDFHKTDAALVTEDN